MGQEKPLRGSKNQTPTEIHAQKQQSILSKPPGKRGDALAFEARNPPRAALLPRYIEKQSRQASD